MHEFKFQNLNPESFNFSVKSAEKCKILTGAAAALRSTCVFLKYRIP